MRLYERERVIDLSERRRSPLHICNSNKQSEVNDDSHFCCLNTTSKFHCLPPPPTPSYLILSPSWFPFLFSFFVSISLNNSDKYHYLTVYSSIFSSLVSAFMFYLFLLPPPPINLFYFPLSLEFSFFLFLSKVQKTMIF